MGKFCTRPFEWIEIQNKDAYLCCPGWMKDIKGVSIEGKSVNEIWNDPHFQDIRASILDGSFRYCDSQFCPFMKQPDMPHWEESGSPFKDKDGIKDPALRHIIEQKITHLESPPLIWNCGHDRTCNLSCPSCRSKIFALAQQYVQKEIAFSDFVLSEIGQDLKYLYITGTGDPFASQVYRELLSQLSSEQYPKLEVHLHTNAVLWTKKNWETMSGINQRITSTHISMDAVTAQTYGIVRRGGDFGILMENLKFVAQLRKEGPLKYVMISFVVQDANFREMPRFIEICEEFGFDLVLFTRVRNWNLFTPYEFDQLAVDQPIHPDHNAFLDILKQPCFDKPHVGIGNFSGLRKKALAQSSQKKIVSVTENMVYRYQWYVRRLKQWFIEHFPILAKQLIHLKQRILRKGKLAA